MKRFLHNAVLSLAQLGRIGLLLLACLLVGQSSVWAQTSVTTKTVLKNTNKSATNALVGGITPTIISGAPTISVTRTPNPMVAGQSYTVRWSSTNADFVYYDCVSTGTGYTEQTNYVALGGIQSGTASSLWIGYPTTCTWYAENIDYITTFTESNITTVAGAPTTNAQFVSQSGIPASMTPGQTVSVTVIMKNTGTTTWPAGSTFKLGSQNPQDNFTWGTNRVVVNTPIVAGNNATFVFNITAPTTPGTYNFQWRMVEDGPVGWFGGFTSLASVLVIAPPTLTATISPNPLNLTLATAGTASGVVMATPSGGTAPYTYSWARTAGTRSTVSSSTVSNPSISAALMATDNFAETWTVTVRDAAAVTTTASVVVNFRVTPPALTATISPNPLNLTLATAGTASGVVTATPSGGTAPYTYSWARTAGTRSTVSSSTASNPSISAALVANDNFAETWTVTVRDAAAVTTTASVVVNFKVTPPALTATISPNPLNLTLATAGTASGVVTATPSGGTAPYTYSWARTAGTRSTVSSSTASNPSISAVLSANDNFAETWTVTVRDAVAVTTTASVVVNFKVTTVTPAPTLSVVRNPNPMIAGQTFTLTWPTTNATSISRSCVAAGTGFTVNDAPVVGGNSTGTASASWVGFPSTCTWIATGPGGTSGPITEIMMTQAAGTEVVTYVHTDGLGSPVAKTNASGVRITLTKYEAYGMTVAGSDVPTIGFTGHYNDADTGLTYMQQRYYDPVAGRFLSEDPVLTDSNSGANFNRYVYAENNPYKYVDPDGRQAIKVISEIIKRVIKAEVKQAPKQAQKIEKEAAKETAKETAKRAPPNPKGQNGKEDHQDKVKELAEKARGEAKQGETVLENRKMEGVDSKRRPDVQIRDEQGNTRKVFEAERHPTHARNVNREAEYNRLKIENETHKVGQ